MTGNFAGLLRVGYATLEAIGNPIPHAPDELTSRLLARMQVRTECRGIWMSLSVVEQDVLRAVVRINDYRVNADSQEAIRTLDAKRSATSRSGATEPRDRTADLPSFC